MRQSQVLRSFIAVSLPLLTNTLQYNGRMKRGPPFKFSSRKVNAPNACKKAASSPSTHFSSSPPAPNLDSLAVPPLNQVRRLLRNRIHGSTQVRTRHQRDHTRIHHAQAGDAVHAQLRIHDPTQLARQHRTRPALVPNRAARVLADVVFQASVADGVGARRLLLGRQLRHRLGRVQPAREADALAQQLHVDRVAQRVEVDDRWAVERVVRVDGDGAARQRLLQDQQRVRVAGQRGFDQGGVVRGDGAGEQRALGLVAAE